MGLLLPIQFDPDRWRAADAGLLRLSDREREVLAFAIASRSLTEAAAVLGITRRTAETHLRYIRAKLGFKSTLQMAVYVVAIDAARRAREAGGA